MKQFYLPQDIIDLILVRAGEMDFELHDKRNEEGEQVLFHKGLLEKGDKLRKEIEKDLCRILGEMDFGKMRIHKFTPKQQIPRHVDDAYPGMDTIVIRLNDGDSRLVIEDQLQDEYCGKAFYMEENTYHEVKPGFDLRYSLTVWVTKKGA